MQRINDDMSTIYADSGEIDNVLYKIKGWHVTLLRNQRECFGNEDSKWQPEVIYYKGAGSSQKV